VPAIRDTPGVSFWGARSGALFGCSTEVNLG
jgi:hypothetical protein